MFYYRPWAKLPGSVIDGGRGGGGGSYYDYGQDYSPDYDYVDPINDVVRPKMTVTSFLDSLIVKNIVVAKPAVLFPPLGLRGAAAADSAGRVRPELVLPALVRRLRAGAARPALAAAGALLEGPAGGRGRHPHLRRLDGRQHGHLGRRTGRLRHCGIPGLHSCSRLSAYAGHPRRHTVHQELLSSRDARRL